MTASIPFHPLADIFPLIEGADFDELVASIRANGQRHPIVMLNGMILDGRNRYRACLQAGVSPLFEPFKGTDPVAFVIDENMHRRHLNESQRGLIAAKFARLNVGDVRSQKAECGGAEISAPTLLTQTQAANLLNVSRDTIQSARVVLAQGTAEEIRAIEMGKAAVSTIARDIRRNLSEEKRASLRASSVSEIGRNPQRIQNHRERAQIYGQVRDALTHLTSLPLPADVVRIVRQMDRKDIVETRLLQAIEWLEAFADAWTSEGQAAKSTRNGHADAGDGGRSA